MKEDLKKKDLNRNILVLSSAILIGFLAIMSYMIYFEVFKAEDIKTQQGNVRYAAKRNEVLRGSIYDREENVLSYSERDSSGKQYRVYSGEKEYAQILGYVSNRGITGIEHYMDKYLIKDDFTFDLSPEYIKGFIKDPGEKIRREKKGNNIKTTLDPRLQEIAYDLMGDEFGKKGNIVALDPKTGEVLAMVNRPSYNPNNLDENYEELLKNTKDDGVLLNRAARGTFFPGSTFKIVTLASALENLEGITERTFKDEGILKVNVGKDLPNVNGTSFGNIGLDKAFSVSSNVVFGSLAIELGGEKLSKTANDFGFNEDLNLADMTVSKSIFTPYSKNDDGLLAASGIGQTGVSTHPLQMAMVGSAIANNGKLMKPYVVSHILKADNSVKEKIEPTVFKESLSYENADIIKNYMVNAVNSSTNQNALVLQNIKAAGKTGTAEDFFVESSESEQEGIKRSVDNSWFVGFAPYDNPEIVVAVNIIDGGYGSGEASRIAGILMSRYLENR
ncbi:MAG: penicillin-binding protein 2 [Clostridium sp.]|nr:penicillin-binding protein 2 [Clostridium sp.]